MSVSMAEEVRCIGQEKENMHFKLAEEVSCALQPECQGGNFTSYVVILLNLEFKSVVNHPLSLKPLSIPLNSSWCFQEPLN